MVAVPDVRQGSKPGNTHREQMFSAVHPITDITKLERDVRKVPNSEVAPLYSIGLRAYD